MTFSIDANGHLDFSQCFMKRCYDMHAISEMTHEYHFSELCHLHAWDGTRIMQMEHERKWRHLVCKHGKDKGPFNPLLDIEIERARRLPVLKEVIQGNKEIDIYAQSNKSGGIDKIEMVVSGIDEDYMVVLGCLNGGYVVRSAYPAGHHYIQKVIQRSNLIDQIK